MSDKNCLQVQVGPLARDAQLAAFEALDWPAFRAMLLGTVHILRHPPRGRGFWKRWRKMTGEGVFELDDVILKIEILEEKLSNF